MLEYNFQSPYYFYKRILIVTSIVLFFILVSVYKDSNSVRDKLLEKFIHELRLTTKLVNNKIAVEEINKSNAFNILGEISKPKEGECFIIDSVGEVVFGFVKNHKLVPKQKSMSNIEETTQSLNDKIDTGELVVKKFYKKKLEKIKDKVDKAYLKQKAQDKRKKISHKPVDWVSLYTQNVSIKAQHKIRDYLKLNKKEILIYLVNKWLYISEEISKVDNNSGEITRYRLIGIANKFSLFIVSLDKVKSCFISSILGLMILLLLILFSVNKQFISPAMLLFNYIKEDGKGNILLDKWHAFWQPWFTITRERFGLKQKRINELKNKLDDSKIYNNSDELKTDA